MRTLTLVALGLLLLVAPAPADEVLLHDGTLLEGPVESLKVSGHGDVPRSAIYSLRLDFDRRASDAQWIEQNLRFALDRARRGTKSGGKVGVYLGRGVFPPSGIAAVRRLDEAGRAPRLLFEDDMDAASLKGLDLVVFPGGWAPSQRDGLGEDGRAALAKFVSGGGRYLGICAGGYLPCSDVVWEGATFPYPLRLAEGKAVGPVPGLVPYPQSQAVDVTADGGKKSTALYAGGSSFEIEGAEVLGRYPDGSAAAVAVRHGKGRLVLTGAHVEFRAKKDRDLLSQDGWATTVEPGDAALFDAYVERLLKKR